MIDVKNEDDAINPNHYKAHAMECIDEMIVVFGVKSVIEFCKINAWKYRYRADNKGQHDTDLEKSDWYIAKAKELSEKNYGMKF